MESATNRVVPMRLFANWETDRATASAVQRMFTMALSRLNINSFPDQHSTLVVTVKLQGYKRTLRSNDFAVTAINGKLDVDLNISFTIQYPHFLKRKSNILQILLQRRKRYKNRQIPGYKTLAIGTVNLAEILQNGSLREIALYDPDSDKDDLQTNNSCIGRLLLASCQSQTFEIENEVTVRRLKEKELVESEEEEDSSTDMPYSENEPEPPDSARSTHKRRMKIRETRQRKIAERKNLKQKFASLLKRFRVPEEGGVDVASQSAGAAPTAQELEELFEELEDLSDSSPEMVMDNLSIVSNPRPGLRPYFASTSSREILPAINDDRGPSDDSDEEWSSEIENNIDVAHVSKSRILSDAHRLSGRAATSLDSSNQPTHYPLATTHSAVHTSITLGSIASQASNMADAIPSRRKISLAEMKLARNEAFSSRAISISDQLSSVLRDDEPWNTAERIWICSLAEHPVLAYPDSSFGLFDCSTFNDCKLVISSIVAKIQKFCNSSSGSPPCTVLGVIGGDKLLSYVLRAYVESLQNKSSDWINFLRFCVIAPPTSAVGRTLSNLDGGRWLLKEIFERTPMEITPNDTKAICERLRTVTDGAVHRLPIGEAMLQFHSKNSDDKDACSQVFVPFLSEVHIGQVDDETESGIFSSRLNDENQTMNVIVSGGAYSSPPSSPHGTQRPDSQDLQIEYWISTNQSGDPSPQANTFFASPTTPSMSGNLSARKESQPIKCSLRSAFRSFTIIRKPQHFLLSLQFVKEKKKEKMLQKLGMKKGQKGDIELQSPSQAICNVARLICSGKHPINVWIDGCSFTGVRFFQTSAQWQTHVKYFPICLPA